VEIPRTLRTTPQIVDSVLHLIYVSGKYTIYVSGNIYEMVTDISYTFFFLNDSSCTISFNLPEFCEE
jgi:hypothetical protein